MDGLPNLIQQHGIPEPRGYDNSIRILSIDPSSSHVGFTISDLDLATGIVKVVLSYTEHVNKYINSNIKEECWTLSENSLKLVIIREIIKRLHATYYPDVVVHEATYCNPRMVSAYRSLTRCIMVITLTFYDIDPEIPVRELEASFVKKQVGAKGGDKELVRAGIDKLIHANKIDFKHTLDDLDEHAIDSIAIGYSYARIIFDEVNSGNYLFI